jgi:hypothetical protein
MSMPAFPVLRTATALLTGLALTAPLMAQVSETGLPGYYRWYKKAGSETRIEDESARDRAMETGQDWEPQSIDRMAPDWSFPDAMGNLVPLRVGGEGRNTLVVTFQSWW